MGLIGGLVQFFLPTQRPRMYYPTGRFVSRSRLDQRRVYPANSMSYGSRRTNRSFRGVPSQSTRFRPVSFPAGRPLQAPVPQRKPGFFDSMLSTNFTPQRTNVSRRPNVVNNFFRKQRNYAMFSTVFRR